MIAGRLAKLTPLKKTRTARATTSAHPRRPRVNSSATRATPAQGPQGDRPAQRRRAEPVGGQPRGPCAIRGSSAAAAAWPAGPSAGAGRQAASGFGQVRGPRVAAQIEQDHLVREEVGVARVEHRRPRRSPAPRGRPPRGPPPRRGSARAAATAPRGGGGSAPASSAAAGRPSHHSKPAHQPHHHRAASGRRRPSRCSIGSAGLRRRVPAAPPSGTRRPAGATMTGHVVRAASPELRTAAPAS